MRNKYLLFKISILIYIYILFYYIIKKWNKGMNIMNKIMMSNNNNNNNKRVNKPLYSNRKLTKIIFSNKVNNKNFNREILNLKNKKEG